MPFIGAGIQTVKGFAEMLLNKKRLKGLRAIHEKDILELLPHHKHSSAKLLLKQTEHQILILEGASREKLRKKEKELLDIMKDNILEKKDELKRKQATQFDVANLLLTIQKLSHETIEEQYSYEKKINKIVKPFEEKFRQFKHTILFLFIYNGVISLGLLYLLLQAK